jgi:hypothetical protein
VPPHLLPKSFSNSALALSTSVVFRAGAGLEVIAEVRARLVVHFISRRLAAVLGDAHVVVRRLKPGMCEPLVKMRTEK